MLKIYNSMSLRKEEFRTVEKGVARLYVCGITPYDTTHLGHAFTYASFDVLVRYLRFLGYDVIYAQNVTDVDDDILRRADAEKRNWKELGEMWTKRFLSDMESLNVIAPTHYVKATGSIGQMKDIIGALLAKGIAYKSARNVYFDVTKFKEYGALSHFSEKQMRLLLRERGGDPDDHDKKNPLDFVLWQGTDGDPNWDAPWGMGRPGWHIECSAMAREYLGEQIDVHGGGRDLIFPHHESEIAQSESYTGKRPFSRYFVHTAMVAYMGEKMAKSLGNLVLVLDLLRKYSPNAIRWLLLSHSYRQMWEYVPEEMDDAQAQVSEMEKMLDGAGGGPGGGQSQSLGQFRKIMDDDLDTPAALRLAMDLAREGRTGESARILDILGFRF